MNFTHDDLVTIGSRWLYSSQLCYFVFTEFKVGANFEIPDVIGFRGNYTILLEAKTSRADFLSDRKKYFRKIPWQGMGDYRFFICEQNMIQPEELPEKWGMIWVNNKGNPRKKIGPVGKIYLTENNKWKFEKNEQAEKSMLLSACRRLQIRGLLSEIYTPVDQI